MSTDNPTAREVATQLWPRRMAPPPPPAEPVPMHPTLQIALLGAVVWPQTKE
jgi:hypothetical protein